jgi:hypothetical protein
MPSIKASAKSRALYCIYVKGARAELALPGSAVSSQASRRPAEGVAFAPEVREIYVGASNSLARIHRPCSLERASHCNIPKRRLTYDGNCDVQFGQRVALIGIVE